MKDSSNNGKRNNKKEPAKSDILEVIKEQYPCTFSRLEKMVKNIEHLNGISNLNDKNLSNFILSEDIELQNIYNTRKLTLCSVGDIVDVNFGWHIHGELSGGHVYCLVYNIVDNGILHLIPIFKKNSANNIEPEYLKFRPTIDIIFNNQYNNEYCILHFNKAQHVHPWRVNSIIGKVSPEFFKTLVNSFTKYYLIHTSVLPGCESIIPKINEIIVSRENNTGSRTQAIKNISTIITPQVEKFNNSLPLPAQINNFLKEINFNNPENIIQYAILVSLSLKKISYETVSPAICSDFKLELPEEKITKILKDNFAQWLFSEHPNILQNSPKIGIASFLRSFRNVYSKNI